MENASKALIIAAGVLIGIILMSIAVYLFVDFGSTAAKINKKNAEQQIVEFNSRFTAYQGLDITSNPKEWTIYDVITVLGYAQENNKYYSDDLGESNLEYINKYKITVFIGAQKVDNWSQTEIKNKLKNFEFDASGKLRKYICGDIEYNEMGRVKKIKFEAK